MRVPFANKLVELAEADDRIVLLAGDLGYGVLEPFIERFPDRYFNLGVAEQNMVGVATGLARNGFVPFVYSIGTFLSMRAYEFLRNGPIKHKLPVRFLGVGTGIEYSTGGSTHMALEEIAILRAQPELMIIVPADHEQAVRALEETIAHPGPIYFSLGIRADKVIDGLDGRFDLNHAQRVREGTDLCFLCMGAVTEQAVAAADALRDANVQAGVWVVSNLHPAPCDDIVATLEATPHVITVEERTQSGGLGTLVCEIAAKHGKRCGRVHVAGLSQMPAYSAAPAFVRRSFRLDAEGLVSIAKEALGNHWRRAGCPEEQGIEVS